MKEFYIVAVKDELTGTFLQPTFGETKEELKRVFEYQINNIKLWKENASDFSLYSIGKFDQDLGLIKPDFYKICSGPSVVRKEEKE